MLNWTNFAMFFLASWVLILSPGPDMIYVMTRGLSQGRVAGVFSAVGVTLGILVHTVCAALGLAVLLQSSALAFAIVKYIGAAYLVYLGIKALRDKSALSLEKDKASLNFRTIFVQGMLSNLFNPKIALFFLAFLPQFVNPEFGHIPYQMLLLGLIFATCGALFLCTLGYFSGHVGSWLFSRPAIADKIRWLTGSVLLGLGLRLAFVRRRN